VIVAVSVALQVVYPSTTHSVDPFTDVVDDVVEDDSVEDDSVEVVTDDSVDDSVETVVDDAVVDVSD
jgi:hypothetical protein